MFSLWCMNKRMEFYLRYPGLNSPWKPTRSYLQHIRDPRLTQFALKLRF